MRHSLFLSLGCLCLVSCAQLHHVQLADLDNRDSTRAKGRPFSIKVSETGVDIREAAGLVAAGAMVNNNRKAAEQVTGIAALISLFQMGPRTGTDVYSVSYAEDVLELIKEECKSGQVTDLISIRESVKYPVISGEIVKINGTCLQ